MNTKSTASNLAVRLAGLIYSTASYLVFLLTVLYLIGFLGRVIVPKNIDDGVTVGGWTAALINTSLLALFAVQHTVMARKNFKAWLIRFIPVSAERSTYVLLSSLVLMLIFWLWRPITTDLWTVDSPLGRALLTGVFWTGWGIVLLATVLISHFELFGLKQAVDRFRNAVPRAQPFKTPLLYKIVRHPLYLGFLIAFWATPDMTAGHFLFALGFSIYIFMGAHIEEKDLVTLFGEPYRRYQREVSMVFPLPRRKRTP